MSEPKDPCELLALLTNKIQQFFTLGGAPFYSPDDIAYMLAHVENPNARLYARVKYANQLGFAEELARSMRIELSRLEEIKFWQVPRPDWLLELSRLALYEDIDPFRCPTCHGIETRLINGRIVVCEACNGSGGAYFTDSERARILKIDKSNWSRIWRWRYDRLRSETIYPWDRSIWETMKEHRNAHHVYAT